MTVANANDTMPVVVHLSVSVKDNSAKSKNTSATFCE